MRSSHDTAENNALRRLTGVTSDQQPAVRIVKFNSETSLLKYRVPGFFTASIAQSLLSRYTSNKLNPYQKDGGNSKVDAPLVKITSDNIEKKIFESSESVLLLISAPSEFCTSCKSIEEAYVQMANQLSSQGIVFGVTNVFEEEFDDFAGAELPQVFLFPKDNKADARSVHPKSPASLQEFIRVETGLAGQEDL